MTIHRTVLAVVVAATVLPLGLACGNAAPSAEVGQRDPDSFRWGVIFTPSERTIRIGGGVGYCEGDPRPRFKRPDVEYRRKNVYIRLELKTRRPQPQKNAACLGSELLVTTTITLRRDLSDLRLYDSGAQPPELRWPR